MKFVLANKNINGETIGYYTEVHSRCNNEMCGQVIPKIQPSEAKKYDTKYEANNDCMILNEKCDLNLRVEPYMDDSDLLSNHNDYNTLVNILSTYTPEDIAMAIAGNLNMKDCVTIITELSRYNANMQNVV